MKKMVVAMLAGTMLLSSGLQASAAGLRDVFDAEYYANSYKDLKDAFGDNEEALYKHFLEYGLKEGRIMNPIIDVAAYRNKYEDLDKAFGDNWDAYIDHYFTYGINENRDNGTDFDLKKYKEAYEDLRTAFGEEDNFLYAKHFIEFGQDENRVKGNKSYEEPKPAASQGEVTTPVVPDSNDMVFEYDANGNVIKEIYYNTDGTVSWTNEYEYDASGNVSIRRGYDANGDLYLTATMNRGENGELVSERTVYSDGWSDLRVYGENGTLTYTERYDAAGNLYSKDVDTYDEDGNNIGYTTYYTNGDYSEFITMQVDGVYWSVAVKHGYADGRYSINQVNDKAQVVRSDYYDAEGNLTSYDEYKYEGDKRTESWYYNGDGTLNTHYVYEYDVNGNYLQTISYRPDGSYYISTSTDTSYSNKYYDADGNFDYWEVIFHDGNFNYISRKTYDEDGNLLKEYVPVLNEEFGYIYWVEKEA